MKSVATSRTKIPRTGIKMGDRNTQPYSALPKAIHYKRIGSLFRALVQEEAISAVCKRCVYEGFAFMCNETFISQKSRQPSFCGDKWHADSSMRGRSALTVTVYIHCPKNEEKMQFLLVTLSWQTTEPVSRICSSSCGDWTWNRRTKRLQPFLRFSGLLGIGHDDSTLSRSNNTRLWCYR